MQDKGFCQHLRMQEQSAQANTLDPRSDTFDVQSYTINAAFLNYQTQKAIDATTVISVVLKESSSQISLDLLELPVSGCLGEWECRIFQL